MVWEQINLAASERHDIWANRYTEGVGWGVPQSLSSEQTYDSRDPEIAMAPSGDGFAVWVEGSDPAEVPDLGSILNGDPYRVISRRLTPGSGWEAEEVVDAPPFLTSVSGRPAERAGIGVDPSGNAIAVWRSGGINSSTGDQFLSVRSSRYTVGDGWSSYVDIESSSINPGLFGDGKDPDVVMDPFGNATAVWNQSGATSNRFQ